MYGMASISIVMKLTIQYSFMEIMSTEFYWNGKEI